ncbi:MULTISPECIES: fimbrial protein [unclassified Serratia (in: enterobacteria)]|uniref:fimbrial protein n=1 Tax=unclassified Serratia (in: enterobacteria) TaxID=2647522 RepID=UPI000500B91B|nr:MULTISPECIES: fimbrial protein [unclassified Serratia (in: enterobacteria)]KFK96799.1 fimbria A protein [Serratia sp. Ag2]KFK97342.1 fimbria A protein [Serratia sp. Ag1]
MSHIKTNAVVAAFISFSAFAAQAADQGSGNVTFNGSIIEAPCSITPQTADQVVSLGQISAASLSNKGNSTPQNFSIDLERCDTTSLKNVSITFNGDKNADDNTLLGIVGDAKGAGIVITNGSGTVVKLGEASPARQLLAGSNTLLFSAYLKGSSITEGSVVPGKFTSIANFTLAYQ